MSERQKEQAQILKQELEKLKPHGYQCWVSDEPNITWSYVITPNKTLLYVEFDQYGAFNIVFKYKPSPDTGTGCSCTSEDGSVLSPTSLTPEIMDEYENQGFGFACRLGAKFYPTPEEGLKAQYCYDSMYQL